MKNFLVNLSKKHKELLSSLLLALVTGIVLFAALFGINKTVAWFAANKDVSASGMEVRPYEYEFDLAVSGDQISHYASDAPIVEYLDTNYGTKNLVKTTGAYRSIICEMQDETPEPPDPGKISPGSYGTISFDIVIDADYDSFRINFDYLALGADISGNPEPIDQADVDLIDLLLSGHVLFFLDRAAGDNGYYYSNQLQNNTIEYVLADHITDKHTESDGDHYTVSVYWVWPINYAQIAYTKGHPYLRTHALFSNETASAANRNAVIADMQSNPEKYFYEYNTDSVTVDFTANNFTNIYYVNLTDGYNNGDQLIGDKVYYMLVKAEVSVIS